jgi:predicted metal-dependent hydrolase
MSELTYTFKQHPRTKGINLKINVKGELIITSRRKLSDAEIEKLLSKHRNWIEGVMQKRPPAEQQQLFDGAEIMLYGDQESIKFVTDPTRKSGVRENGPYLEVNAEAGNHEEILHNWLLKVARQGIIARVEELAAAHGFEYKHVSVRDQSTRWGSCSAQKNLNFNWRLALAPLHILDYVIIHELAHTKQMNHSPKFWEIVENCMPGYKQHIKWLKQNGNLLHMY